MAMRWEVLERGQRMKLIGAVLAFVAVLIAAIVIGRQPDWRVLFANVNDKDGGAIIAQLSQMNVPYKHAEGGGTILVPADRVHDVRLRLATQGLPKGAISGFEAMEANRFGMTQFQERVSFQRGLEGELTRSIQALSSVQGARVHLAMPNQNGFFRDQQKPSASVLLSLHPGRTLERAQIAGIVHLVASSVPELAPSAVSVVDDSGKLLSTTSDAGAGGGDVQQLQYVQQIEQAYNRRILELLEPVVGRQNVKAQVTADVDFSQTESTSEQHRPNLSPDASAVRSQQIVESGAGAGGAQPTGVPGAVSNQPAGAASAPINGAPAPLAAAGTGGAGLAAGARRESTVNYEVDKTVRVVRVGSGSIKRINAAVVINHQTTPDAQGKPSTKPLSDQQVEQLTALVREAVGFNKDRGDSVNVVNAPFLVESVPVVEVPLWKQPQVLDMARSFAWPAALVLLAALLLFGLVRPAIKNLSNATTVALRMGPDGKPLPAGTQVDAMIAETPERPALPGPNAVADPNAPVAPTPEQLRLEEARKLARSNPIAVANIMRDWMNGGSSEA